MNAQQQYQKLVSMRAQTAQMHREDNALREYQRLQGGGFFNQTVDEQPVVGGPAEENARRMAAYQDRVNEFGSRQRRDLEMSDELLQGRPFVPDVGLGGFMTSGAERAGAMTQARRGARQAQIQGAPPAAPRVVPAARRGGIFGRTPGAT